MNCFLYLVLLSAGIIINDYCTNFDDKYSICQTLIFLQLVVCIPLFLIDHIAHCYAFRSVYTQQFGSILDIIVLIGIEVYSILMYNNIGYLMNLDDQKEIDNW